MEGTLDLKKIVSDSENYIEEILSKAYPSRSIRLQKQAAGAAWYLAGELANYKDQARQGSSGNVANTLLSIQCCAASVASESEMWFFLPDAPDSAWIKLIDAQEYLGVAARAHEVPWVIERRARLVDLENILFPRVMFVSAGMSYKSGRCTVCASRFDHCAHLEGGVYGGRLCREVQRRNVRFDHVAFVECPRDKRCRVISFEDEHGKQRNCFTGESTDAVVNSEEVEGRRVQVLAFSEHTLKQV